MTGERDTHQDHVHHGDSGGPAHHEPHHTAGGHHRTHRFDPAHAEGLYSDHRRQITPPDLILAAAGIASGQVVVDLGAGPGFFSLPIAQLVGEHGRVYAVDTEPRMLEVCQRRASDAGISWIETVHSEERRVPLADGLADRVFIAFVLHEADDPNALLREAVRLLRPAGEITIVESPKAEGTPGPPMEHRIGEDELALLARQVGLSMAVADQRGERFYVARLRGPG